MGEIIEGWRRKTGLFLLVLVLVLAMPLAMGWLRSFNSHDGVWLSLGIRCDRIESHNGLLSWLRTNRPTSYVSFFPFSNGITHLGQVDLWSEVDYDRRGKWMGFEFGATTYHESWSPSYFEFWVVPYWSLVLPPTLLAAYLLLCEAAVSDTAGFESRRHSPHPE